MSEYVRDHECVWATIWSCASQISLPPHTFTHWRRGAEVWGSCTLTPRYNIMQMYSIVGELERGSVASTSPPTACHSNTCRMPSQFTASNLLRWSCVRWCAASNLLRWSCVRWCVASVSFDVPLSAVVSRAENWALIRVLQSSRLPYGFVTWSLSPPLARATNDHPGLYLPSHPMSLFRQPFRGQRTGL